MGDPMGVGGLPTRPSPSAFICIEPSFNAWLFNSVYVSVTLPNMVFLHFFKITTAYAVLLKRFCYSSSTLASIQFK